MPTVTIIIVNWNGAHFIERCLSSLVSQTVPAHEIILVDNASSDASLEIVRRFPSVRVLAQGKNLGFARANNLAVEAADKNAEWIALLNPDAVAEQDWLARLIAATKCKPDVAAFGSRQMVFGKAGMLDGTGDVCHVSGLVWRNGYGRLQNATDRIATEIFSPCACAALYRRDAFVKAGGFDEDYFCYVEDVDLGFRLRLAGHRAMYVPDAVVYHIGSESSGGRHSDFSVYHGQRNVVWTYIKNMPGILFWVLLPLHIAANCLIIYRYSRAGQGETIWRAKRDAIRGVPNMWRRRREVQAQRQASLSSIWHVLNKGLRRPRAQQQQ